MLISQIDTAQIEVRSLEDPRVQVHNWDGLDDILGQDMKPSSGVRVNRETAFKLSGYWRGINLIANTVARLPLRVRALVADGGEEDDPTHPAYHLLLRQSAPEYRAKTVKQTLIGHAVGLGNGYGAIGRKRSGDPYEIIPLLPDRTFPSRINGRLMYYTTLGGVLDDPKSKIVWLYPEDVLHIKGLSFDGLVGYSLLRVASEGFGLGIAQQQYGASFFANAATPKFTIESPARLSDQAYARLANTWKHMKAGLSQAHRSVILEEGAKANPLTINPAESQLLESREFDLVTCANYLLMSPHKLGVKGYSSNNSLEQSNQETADDAYEPWLVEFETECEMKLLTEEQKRKPTHVIEFDRTHLVRANLDARATYYRTATGGMPWMSQWEVRCQTGLDPRVGRRDIPIPLNMGSEQAAADGGIVSKKGQQQNMRSKPYIDANPDEPTEKDWHRLHCRIVEDAVGRMCRRVAADAERLGSKGKWASFVEGFPVDHAPKIIEALEPSAELCSVNVSEWLIREMTACSDKETLTTRLAELPKEAITFVGEDT